MEKYEASYDQICNQERGLVMIPGNWNITQTITLCRNFGGEINVIKDPKINEEVRELGIKTNICRRNGGNTFDFNYLLTENYVFEFISCLYFFEVCFIQFLLLYFEVF